MAATDSSRQAVHVPTTPAGLNRSTILRGDLRATSIGDVCELHRLVTVIAGKIDMFKLNPVSAAPLAWMAMLK
jgi:hypothetical protein